MWRAQPPPGGTRVAPHHGHGHRLQPSDTYQPVRLRRRQHAAPLPAGEGGCRDADDRRQFPLRSAPPRRWRRRSSPTHRRYRSPAESSAPLRSARSTARPAHRYHAPEHVAAQAVVTDEAHPLRRGQQHVGDLLHVVWAMNSLNPAARHITSRMTPPTKAQAAPPAIKRPFSSPRRPRRVPTARPGCRPPCGRDPRPRRHGSDRRRSRGRRRA